jgi:hypothetical protein
MATLARTAAAKVMANRPWTPEGEEELLELRGSGVPLRLVATEAAVVGRAGVLKAKQAKAKKE